MNVVLHELSTVIKGKGVQHVYAMDWSVFNACKPIRIKICMQFKYMLAGKILIDITYYGSGVFGRPSPPQGYSSAIAYHRDNFADATASWAAGFKSVNWRC